MAISQIQSYGQLDNWRDYTLENIWHFNQITGVGAYLQSVPVYVQPDRDMVARAIAQAWGQLTRVLHFHPAPIFTYEDIEIGHRIPINQQTLKLSKGYVQAIGQRAVSLLDDDATVTYSDVAGIGVDDTATVTITDASTSLDEISLFFRVADGAKSAANEYYEIIPTEKSRSGNTVTITAHRANFVKPNGVWIQPFKDPNYTDRNPGDTQDATDFVTLVDVYRVYADDTSAVTLVGASPCSTTCEESTCTACARIVDSMQGHIRVTGDCSCCIYPEKVRVYYKSGYPLVNNKIDPELGITLFRLANCLMPRQPCAVQNRYYDVWAADRTINRDTLTQADAQSPFGIMYGQIEAWRVAQWMALGQGGAMTNMDRGGWLW